MLHWARSIVGFRAEPAATTRSGYSHSEARVCQELVILESDGDLPGTPTWSVTSRLARPG